MVSHGHNGKIQLCAVVWSPDNFASRSPFSFFFCPITAVGIVTKCLISPLVLLGGTSLEFLLIVIAQLTASVLLLGFPSLFGDAICRLLAATELTGTIPTEFSEQM